MNLRIAFSHCKFQQALLQKSDGKDYYIIQVAGHKTATSYGPAKIVVNAQCYADMEKFMEVRRGRGDDVYFFCGL